MAMPKDFDRSISGSGPTLAEADMKPSHEGPQRQGPPRASATTETIPIHPQMRTCTVQPAPAELERLVKMLMGSDYVLALHLLEAALNAAPDDLELLSCAGSCLQELRRWPEAHQHLERAAALDPSGRADLELA